MSLVVPFTRTEEERLSAVAKQIGMAPAELIRRLALEHLPHVPADTDGRIDALLRRWQEEDGTDLMPDVPTPALFARWAAEDAGMTDEEREAEDRLWRKVQESLNGTRAALRMRRL